MKIVHANIGLNRKRQKFVAELITYSFKSGGHSNNEAKLKLKKTFIGEILDADSMFQAFPEKNVNAEQFFANENACQILWANLQMAIHCFESILDFVESTHFLETFMNFVNVFFDKLGFSLLLFLSSSGLNNTENTPEQRLIQEAQAEKALSILETFAEMIQVFLKSCRCVKQTNNQIMMKLIPMISILDKLYCLRMGNLSKNENNIIFEPTSKPKINDILTKFKMNILDSVKELLTFYNLVGKNMLTKKKKSLEKIQSNQKINQMFLLNLNSIIRLSINSLICFFSNPEINLEEILNDVDLHSLIVEAIRIFQLSANHCESFNAISEKKIEIFSLVFFPSLVQSPELQELMTENPDDFIQRNNFFISKELKDYSLRMISINAIKTLCNKIDGYLSQIVNLTINSVLICMGLLSKDNIVDENERRSYEFLCQTSYWANLDNRHKVDVCFLILSELRDQVHIRTDLILKIETFIKMVFPQLTIHCEDNLILTRMIFFCGKYLNIIYQKDEQALMDVLKWVLENLRFQDIKGFASEIVTFVIMMNDNHTKSLNFQNSIRIFIDDPKISAYIIENLMHRITINFRPNIIEAFITLIKINPKFFEENDVLFEKYLEKLINIIKHITEQPQQGMQKPMISNVWFLLKQICELENIYKKYDKLIEPKIAALFPLIDKMHQDYNFDEDLVECLVAWNSHSTQVSDYSLSFIPYMEKVQNKNYGCLGKMCGLLNNYFIFATDKFSDQDVQMVLGMALKSINVGENPTKNMPFYLVGTSTAKGFLLIQMILMSLNHLFLDTTLETIIGVFKQFYMKNFKIIESMYIDVDYFEEDYEDKFIEHSRPMFYFDKMMGIFLMSAYLFPGKVLKHFLEFEYSEQIPADHQLFRFSYIIDLICSRYDEFLHDYDRKLWIISFSKMIEFFLGSYQESNRKDHLDLLKNLIYKTVLILKSFQLNIKIQLEHQSMRKNPRFMDVFMESCDEFNTIREALNIQRSAQSLFNNSHNSYGYEEYDEEENVDYSFIVKEKQSMMKNVQSPLLKVDEIQEFRRVMINVRQNEQVFNYIKNGMPKIVQKYFSKVAFEFEKIGHRIRNIRKLKPRKKM